MNLLPIGSKLKQLQKVLPIFVDESNFLVKFPYILSVDFCRQIKFFGQISLTFLVTLLVVKTMEFMLNVYSVFQTPNIFIRNFFVVFHFVRKKFGISTYSIHIISQKSVRTNVIKLKKGLIYQVKLKMQNLKNDNYSCFLNKSDTNNQNLYIVWGVWVFWKFVNIGEFVI
eukprot:TRINITY_DN46737_c0_g1_i1.p1 TRINITY_DN46737_c0_g1~~TRINITY_DN46737_c0_g1_i1.p1  ORF type:complete len:170 (+),score=0.63 TRINITY_DN46737_c0_g1_i1:244-753(+)